MNSSETLIDSISELIHSLNKYNKNNYPDVIKNIELNPEDVKNYCTWDADNYTRNLIYRNDHYLLLILCWQKGQYSSIHDHGGSDCFIYVIDGIIQENIYQLNRQKDLIHCQENIYKQGYNSYIIDEMGLHCIKSVSDRAITLHLYAEPIEFYHIFDP